MTNKYTDPNLIKAIRDGLVKRIPSMRDAPSAYAPLIDTRVTTPDLDTTGKAYFYQTSTSSIYPSPNIDIAVLKHSYHHYETGKDGNKLQPDDIANYPKAPVNDPKKLAKWESAVNDGCVIAVQSNAGIFPFRRVFLFDRTTHEPLKGAFKRAASFGLWREKEPDPDRIALKIAECTKKYADLEKGFHAGLRNTAPLLLKTKDFLSEQNGHKVSVSSHPTATELSLNVDVSMGFFARLFNSKAGANGSYALKMEVMPICYGAMLENPAFDREDVMNIRAIRKEHTEIKNNPNALLEDELDFYDLVKASPVVKITTTTAAGHTYEKYYVAVDDKKSSDHQKLLNMTVTQTMKDFGPRHI